MRKNGFARNISYWCFLVLLISCLDGPVRKNKTERKIDNFGKKAFLDKEYWLDSEVINQTIQSIVDSLNHQIKINLGDDYSRFNVIYISDSLRGFQPNKDVYRKARIITDSINFEEKSKSKLNLLNRQLKGGKELKTISNYKEYSDLISCDYKNRVLLFFSQVHFNKKYNEGIFTLSFTTHINTGSDYAIYVRKENGKWVVKRVLLAAFS